jgi:hypothetical protein
MCRWENGAWVFECSGVKAKAAKSTLHNDKILIVSTNRNTSFLHVNSVKNIQAILTRNPKL